MIKLNNYNEIKIKLKNKDNFFVDLSNLTNTDYQKVMCFLSGFTFNKGKLIKLQSKIFKIEI